MTAFPMHALILVGARGMGPWAAGKPGAIDETAPGMDCEAVEETSPTTTRPHLLALPPFSFPLHFLPDIVSPKMVEELKSQLDSLAQEVALLKEQQALQTGECGKPNTPRPPVRPPLPSCSRCTHPLTHPGEPQLTAEGALGME